MGESIGPMKSMEYMADWGPWSPRPCETKGTTTCEVCRMMWVPLTDSELAMSSVTKCEASDWFWARYELGWPNVRWVDQMWALLTKCEASDWFWARCELGWPNVRHHREPNVSWVDQMWGIGGNPFCHLSSSDRQMGVASLWGRRGLSTGAMVFIYVWVGGETRDHPDERLHWFTKMSHNNNNTHNNDNNDAKKCLTHNDVRTKCLTTISQNVSSWSHLHTPPRNQEIHIAICISPTYGCCQLFYPLGSELLIFFPSLVIGPEMVPNSKGAQFEHQSKSWMARGTFIKAQKHSQCWSEIGNTIILEISHAQVSRKFSVNRRWLEIDRDHRFLFLIRPNLRFSTILNSFHNSQYANANNSRGNLRFSPRLQIGAESHRAMGNKVLIFISWYHRILVPSYHCIIISLYYIIVSSYQRIMVPIIVSLYHGIIYHHIIFIYLSSYHGMMVRSYHCIIVW